MIHYNYTIVDNPNSIHITTSLRHFYHNPTQIMKLIYYRHNKHAKMEALTPRKTFYVELTLVNNGTMEYTVNKRKITLKPGDILYVKEPSTISRHEVNNTDYISFNFLYDEDDEDTYALPIHIKEAFSHEIQLLLSACNEIFYNNNEYSEQLCLLIKCILKQLQINVQQKKFNPITLQIINYLNAHLDRNITLKEISEITFFSPTYCSKVFRNDTKKSIMEYFIDRKIEEIKSMIVQGTPFKQIAEKLGFSSYSYMSRIFAVHEGYTPIKFKQQIHSDNVKTDTPYKLPEYRHPLQSYVDE